MGMFDWFKKKPKTEPDIVLPPPANALPIPVSSLTREDRAYMYWRSTRKPSWPFEILSGSYDAINDAINTGAREGGYTYRGVNALAYNGKIKGLWTPADGY